MDIITVKSPSALQTIIENTTFVSLTDSKQRYGSDECMPLLTIASPLCDAVISLQGAQLLTFKVKQGTPLLWLSPKAVFSESKAIRGGVPVCAPWFGVNQQAPSKPKHGIVRTQPWALKSVSEQDNGTVELAFEFTSTDKDLKLFPHPFKLAFCIRLSSKVTFTLTATNLSKSPMPFSWALHSYFNVDSLSAARVQGLSNNTYLDAVDGFSSQVQTGDVLFDGEVDRVYESVQETQTINSKPSITIKGDNCPTAIVWNPGENLAHQMADIGAENYDQFICVERGAAFGDSWNIAASETKSATLSIS